MTFRQLIDVLWGRRWLIVTMVVVAVAVAASYLFLKAPSYSSTAVVRENATVTTAAQSGELGNAPVDFDTTTITTEKILGPAARYIKLPENALLGEVSYTVTQGVQTTTIAITAKADTPSGAQRATSAVVSTYRSYLQNQANTALKALTQRQSQASAQAQKYQKQVTDDPSDSIAQAGLTSSLSSLGSIDDQIQSITNSGSPLVVMTSAQPGEPVGPSAVTVLLVALAAGLIAGIGVALVREQFDNRLRGEHEFESLTGLRSLGELVWDRQAARGKDLLPAAGIRPTALLEGMRAVRTSVQVLLPQKNTVVVVTSAQPGDGKTFVAANLALSLARAGRKVVLVGGDMRRPALQRYFHDAAEGAGLAGLLETSRSRKVTAHDVDSELRTTPYAGLRVLPAGNDVNAVGDLLAASDVQTVMAHLREAADVVIVDSPPALTVVDATLLASHADGVVMVAAVRKVDRGLLAATVDTLQQNGIPMLGIVANRSRRSMPRPNEAYYIKGAVRSVA